MAKRFSPKAGDYTARLAAVQAEIAEHQKALNVLKEEQQQLQAFLTPFYDLGETEVGYGDDTLRVIYSQSERTYLDQEKARLLLAKLGKKAPEFTTTVVSFKVKS